MELATQGWTRGPWDSSYLGGNFISQVHIGMSRTPEWPHSLKVESEVPETQAIRVVILTPKPILEGLKSKKVQKPLFLHFLKFGILGFQNTKSEGPKRG